MSLNLGMQGSASGLASPRKPPPLEQTNAGHSEVGLPKVLVLGVCLCDHPNNADSIVSALARTADYEVTQRWIAVGEAPLPSWAIRYGNGQLAPKYTLLNGLLTKEDLAQFQYVVIVDDDIGLPDHFLDRFLSLQARFDLRDVTIADQEGRVFELQRQQTDLVSDNGLGRR